MLSSFQFYNFYPAYLILTSLVGSEVEEDLESCSLDFKAAEI